MGAYLGSGTELDVLQAHERADLHPVAQFDLTFQHDVDIDLHVLADPHAAALVHPRRVDQTRTGRAQRPGLAQLPGALQLGQLPRIVGALGLQRIGDQHHLGRAEFGRGHGEDVGQVVLALHVVAGQLRQPATQRGRLGGDDAGVDGVDVALLIVGVLVLDDGADLAGGIAQHPAVAARIVGLGDQHGQAAGRMQQPQQGLRTDQRHVAVQHQHGGRIGNVLHRLLDRVAGAKALGLLGPDQVELVGKGLAHLLAAMAVDHVDGSRTQGARGLEHVRQHRPPGDGLEHLGPRGLHPLAFAGGEDDHVQGQGHGGEPAA